MFRGWPAVLLLPLLLPGCRQSAGPAVAKGEEFVLTSVSLHADDNGRPGAEVGKFDYRQKTQHYRAILNRPGQDISCSWVFTAKRTSAGNDKPIQTLQTKLQGNEMTAQLTLEPTWPVGLYHVDVLIDGRAVGGFDYEVTGRTEKLVFLQHTIAPDDGRGNPGKPVKRLKASDRTVHIQVATKGVDDTEPEVIWRLFRVAGGKDVEIGNTLQPKMRLQDSVLKAMFGSAGDWKPGAYRADIYLNGKKVHAVAFEVQE